MIPPGPKTELIAVTLHDESRLAITSLQGLKRPVWRNPNRKGRENACLDSAAPALFELLRK